MRYTVTQFTRESVGLCPFRGFYVREFDHTVIHTGKNNGFPFLDILGYLKNTHKNPKFGKVRQVPTREFQPSSLIGTCLTLPNLGFLWAFFKFPKISKNGNPLFFPVPISTIIKITYAGTQFASEDVGLCLVYNS